MNFELKIAVKMNLRMITKNHAADPKIGFPRKPILKPYGHSSPCRQRGCQCSRLEREIFKELSFYKRNRKIRLMR